MTKRDRSSGRCEREHEICKNLLPLFSEYTPLFGALACKGWRIKGDQGGTRKCDIYNVTDFILNLIL